MFSGLRSIPCPVALCAVALLHVAVAGSAQAQEPAAEAKPAPAAPAKPAPTAPAAKPAPTAPAAEPAEQSPAVAPAAAAAAPAAPAPAAPPPVVAAPAAEVEADVEADAGGSLDSSSFLEHASPSVAPFAAPSVADVQQIDMNTVDPEDMEPALTVSGDFFSRYELRANVDTLAPKEPTGRFAEGDRTVYRARLGFAPRPIEFGDNMSTAVFFQPQASGSWGPSGGLADSQLGLHQATITLNSSRVKWDVGRFEMSYGEELIIGSVGWHQTGRSFDGTRLRWKGHSDRYWVDVFLTMIDEGTPSYTRNVGEGDEYFGGVYMGLGRLLGELDLDFYALVNGRPPTDGYSITTETGGVQSTMVNNRDGSARVTIGSRIAGESHDIDYRAEAGVQVGTELVDNQFGRRDVMAYHADAEVGLRLADRAFRVAAEGVIASGDKASSVNKNEGWNELYPTGHKFLGLMDVIGKRNDILGGVLHLSYKVDNDLRATLDGHFYTKPERDDAFIGPEFDLGAVYAIGGGLNARLLYGVFVPNKDAFTQRADTAHYLEAELRHIF